MSKKVTIDEDECTGCGTCESLAPDIFKMDDNTGKAIVIKAVGGDQSDIDSAIDACPSTCIHQK